MNTEHARTPEVQKSPEISPEIEVASVNEKPPLPKLVAELQEQERLLPHDKMMLLLMFLGEKPACEISPSKSKLIFTKDPSQVDLRNIPDNVRRKIIDRSQAEREIEKESEGSLKLIGQAKLLYFSQDSIEEEIEGVASLRRQIFVATNQSIANALATAWKQEDGIAIGRLLGYPETALRASGSEEEYRQIENSMDPQDRKYLNFGFFGLSKEHWQDELPLMKRWATAVEQYAPALYQRYVQGQ